MLFGSEVLQFMKWCDIRVFLNILSDRFSLMSLVEKPKHAAIHCKQRSLFINKCVSTELKKYSGCYITNDNGMAHTKIIEV
jgi:hypothetical protein